MSLTKSYPKQQERLVIYDCELQISHICPGHLFICGVNVACFFGYSSIIVLYIYNIITIFFECYNIMCKIVLTKMNIIILLEGNVIAAILFYIIL